MCELLVRLKSGSIVWDRRDKVNCQVCESIVHLTAVFE